MVRSEYGTRADATYERLRADILSGRLKPGERLKFPYLSSAYGVGIGAIREALARLSEQDFVRSSPHAGVSVTPLSADDLIDLTEARVEIEQIVLRRSIERGDMAWESSIVAMHYTLGRTPMYDQDDPERISDDWAIAHRDFHGALLAGCDVARLKTMATSLRDAASLYQAWSQQIGRKPHRDAAHEHHELMELTLARDADQAVPVLGRHIRRTTEVLLAGTSLAGPVGS